MRLGLLTPEWYPDENAGGIGSYCRIVADAAVNAGHEVVVFAATTQPWQTAATTRPWQTGATTRPRRTVATARSAEGHLVVPVPITGLGPVEVGDAFADRVAGFLAAGERLDVVEAAEFAAVAVGVAERGLVPVVTRLHTPLALIVARNGGYRIYRDDALRCALEERQVRASALVTSPTRWLAAQALELWDLPAPPLVIPNPVDLDPAPGPVGRTAGAVTALYIGRLEYRKGVLTLATAARDWLATRDDAELVFVGGDTRWSGRSVAERVHEILGEYTARCRFLSARHPAAVRDLIDDADLVVLPSRYENFSYACLEAMARGRSVLATTGSGFDEIIEPGRTGFLVPPDDPTALAAALASRLADRPLLAEVGARARIAVRRWAADRVVPRLCTAMREAAVDRQDAGR